MSQTDIRNSSQYQQVPVKTRPSHSSAAEFDFLACCWGFDVACVVMPQFVCLSAMSKSKLSKSPEKVLFFFWQPQLLLAYQSSLWLQTFLEHMWVRMWACVYFPYGCSRSPLNKNVVPLLSKPTSFVSNEHLPGSFPATAGFSVSPCQQPMTLICCFITPKRCVWGKVSGEVVQKCRWVSFVCFAQICVF